MKQHIEETKFESIYQELMYEVQDVIDLLNHILGARNSAPSVIDVFSDYIHRPANDNWPIYETKNDETIKADVV